MKRDDFLLTPHASPLTREEGWESRLAAVIEAARREPYVLGTHDCFRVACAAVEALTGVDLWTPWAGRYATRREALTLLARYAGERGSQPHEQRTTNNEQQATVFTQAFSRLFCTSPAPMSQARRGDICEYFEREQHLGVCNGAEVAVLGERGLKFVPRSACTHCWRIG